MWMLPIGFRVRAISPSDLRGWDEGESFAFLSHCTH